jgi:hypothetical protein
MNNMYYSHGLGLFPALGPAFLILIALVVAWTLIWKGVALWHAARNHQTAWFVVLLILNTLGILEIIYILFFRKNKNHTVVTTTTTHVTTVSTPPPAVDSSSTPAE